MAIFLATIFVSFILYGFYVMGYVTAYSKYDKIVSDAQKNAVESLLIAKDYKTAYAQLEKERSPSKD